MVTLDILVEIMGADQDTRALMYPKWLFLKELTRQVGGRLSTSLKEQLQDDGDLRTKRYVD
jgi:hypothetical protein